jgi:transcription factor MYB, plant
MARSGGGMEGSGGLKKGPWTQAEDKLLRDHVRRHGEGNWNAVRRETRLQRCGKSCRLRWANHLRPNLRKCPFSPEEERQILLLHGLIGNKWARISKHVSARLPGNYSFIPIEHARHEELMHRLSLAWITCMQLSGRTDNEIKNYWNTRFKRRQRAGLPPYPPDVERQIKLLRAQNVNPFADADADAAHANASAGLPAPPLLYDVGNPFALLSSIPSLSQTASHSHSPLINQNYPLLNQMQVFHHLGGSQQPSFHQDGSAAAFGDIVSSRLPPLPTARTQAELHSNQFDTSISGGLVDQSMLIGDEHLLRPNPSMVKVSSMPALSYREPDGSRMLPAHGAGSDGDVSSLGQCPPGQDLHRGATWDFTFGQFFLRFLLPEKKLTLIV